MILRVARHTGNLEKITRFYTELLGLEVLGFFKDHAGYNGIFLGLKNLPWHLEFTSSPDKPIHHPDEDDLLVFYLENEKALTGLTDKLIAAGHTPVKAKNPYWQTNGACFADPDGFGIIPLHSKK